MFQTAKAQYRYDKIINRYFNRREKVSVFTLLIKQNTKKLVLCVTYINFWEALPLFQYVPQIFLAY